MAGRFRLDDLLSDHTGARSWRATDLTLARNVAVHVVPAADPRAAAALTAARTSATVSDGRVLRVLDALEEDDHVSIVHEWGSGLSLDHLVAQEPLPARRAAWLVREVAEAVAVAHRYGVAHGRLLPENVMVNDAGSVKIAGFVVDGVLLGQSRATDGDAAQRPTGRPSSDHEADVRNLGGLLYAALTGRWPGSPASVLPPAPTAERGLVCRPRQVRSGVPRALDLLCDRIVNAPDHASRAVESAAQVADALSTWLGEPVAGTAVTSAGILLGDDVHPWEGPDPRLDVAPHSDDRSDRHVDHGDRIDPEETQAWQAYGDTGDVPDGSTTRPVAPLAPAPPTAPTSTPVRGLVTVRDTAPARSDVPVHWGPDRPEDPPPGPAEPPSGGVPWLRLAAVLAVMTLAVLAVVVALDLGSTRNGDPEDQPTADASSPTASPSRPVPVTVTSFDPDDQSGGPPEENQDLVPLVTDGDAATSWTTETYRDGPPLAPYKRGLGLLLDLGEPTPVSAVDVTLAGGAHDLTLFAAPDATAAPTDVTGLPRAARETGVEGRVRLRPADVTTRWLVVWLTALPVSGSGFQGQVGEVVVRS